MIQRQWSRFIDFQICWPSSPLNCYKSKLVILARYQSYWWLMQYLGLVHWDIRLLCIRSCSLMSLMVFISFTEIAFLRFKITESSSKLIFQTSLVFHNRILWLFWFLTKSYLHECWKSSDLQLDIYSDSLPVEWNFIAALLSFFIDSIPTKTSRQHFTHNVQVQVQHSVCYTRKE